jgi:hypothetical protein
VFGLYQPSFPSLFFFLSFYFLFFSHPITSRFVGWTQDSQLVQITRFISSKSQSPCISQ